MEILKNTLIDKMTTLKYCSRMKEDKQIFVEWLRHIIKIEGKMKGYELADASGIHATTISKYITGKSYPRSQDEMDRICKALDADYKQIILEGRAKDGQIEKAEIPGATVRATPGKATVPAPIDPITEEHKKLVPKFTSKKLAFLANQIMVDIDREDPMRFAELTTIIKKFASGTEFREIYKNEEEKTGDQAQGKPKLKNGTNDPV